MVFGGRVGPQYGKSYLHMFIEILANRTQLSDVAPGPLVFPLFKNLLLVPTQLCLLQNFLKRFLRNREDYCIRYCDNLDISKTSF